MKKQRVLFPSSHTLPFNARDGQLVAVLHRFHDRAAVYLSPCEANGKNRKPSNALAYLTAKEARAIASALLRISRSIEQVEFGQSTGTNWTILEELNQ